MLCELIFHALFDVWRSARYGYVREREIRSDFFAFRFIQNLNEHIFNGKNWKNGKKAIKKAKRELLQQQ